MLLWVTQWPTHLFVQCSISQYGMAACAARRRTGIRVDQIADQQLTYPSSITFLPDRAGIIERLQLTQQYKACLCVLVMQSISMSANMF